MRGEVDHRVSLLHGPYRAPRLRVGDRAACLCRDCDVKITGWTDAPFPWPQGVPVGGRSAPSILLDDELARAVRLESAAAIRYWWDVSAGVVWRWRKALGVGRMDNPGSRHLILAASAKGADAGGGTGAGRRMEYIGRRAALTRRDAGEGGGRGTRPHCTAVLATPTPPTHPPLFA